MVLYTKAGQILLVSGDITHFILMETSVIVENKDVLRRIFVVLPWKIDGCKLPEKKSLYDP